MDRNHPLLFGFWGIFSFVACKLEEGCWKPYHCLFFLFFFFGGGGGGVHSCVVNTPLLDWFLVRLRVAFCSDKHEYMTCRSTSLYWHQGKTWKSQPRRTKFERKLSFCHSVIAIPITEIWNSETCSIYFHRRLREEASRYSYTLHKNFFWFDHLVCVCVCVCVCVFVSQWNYCHSVTPASSFRSVAVITCASHAQGPRFDPGRKHEKVFLRAAK